MKIMSRPRYAWWGYVKSMIRNYPKLAERYSELHTTPTTVSYTEQIGGGGPSRTTENVAIRELPGTHQREYEAVKHAIEATSNMKTGRDRLKIIQLVFWNRTHSLAGAAQVIHVGYDCAQTYHGEFIRMVAGYYGLLDDDISVNDDK